MCNCPSPLGKTKRSRFGESYGISHAQQICIIVFCCCCYILLLELVMALNAIKSSDTPL